MLLSFYCPQPTSDKLPVVRELPPPAVIYLVCRAPLGSGSPARSGSAKYPVYPHNILYTRLPLPPTLATCLPWLACPSPAFLVKNFLQKANPPNPWKRSSYKRHHKNPPVCITDMNPSVMHNPSCITHVTRINTRAWRSLRIGYIPTTP